MLAQEFTSEMDAFVYLKKSMHQEVRFTLVTLYQTNNKYLMSWPFCSTHSACFCTVSGHSSCPEYITIEIKMPFFVPEVGTIHRRDGCRSHREGSSCKNHLCKVQGYIVIDNIAGNLRMLKWSYNSNTCLYLLKVFVRGRETSPLCSGMGGGGNVTLFVAYQLQCH